MDSKFTFMICLVKLYKREFTYLLGLWLLTACAPQPPLPSPGHLNQISATLPPKEDIPPTIQQVPFLPPPSLSAPQEVYTVVVNEIPVDKLLFTVARDAKLDVDIQPGITGTVTLNAINQTLPQLLDRIAKQVNLRYEINDKLLTVGPDLPYLKTYKIGYVNISRDSQTEMAVSTQIIGDTKYTVAGGGGGGGGGSGGTGENNSQIGVKNSSNHRFWQTLGKNINAILGHDSPAGGGGDTANESNVISTPDVIFNPESGIINIRATHKQHKEIQHFLDQVLTSAQRQVLIEATIVEVNLNDRYQAGIDWQRIAGDFSYVQTMMGGNLGKPPFYSFEYKNPNSPFGNISATLRLLEQFGNVKVLSSPRIMALNNQTAILKVVDNRVYFSVAAIPTTLTNLRGDLVTSFSYATTPNVLPVGLIMNVTPQISEEEIVILNVRPTISRIIGFQQDPNPDLARAGVISQVPEVQVREMESILKINNGDIAIIGGLMQDTAEQNKISVPVLSELPLVGDLFSYRDDSYKKTELVIFLRPVVIKEASVTDDLKEYKKYLPSE